MVFIGLMAARQLNRTLGISVHPKKIIAETKIPVTSDTASNKIRPIETISMVKDLSKNELIETAVASLSRTLSFKTGRLPRIDFNPDVEGQIHIELNSSLEKNESFEIVSNNECINISGKNILSVAYGIYHLV